ncbi:protein-glutamine gamma-glutamyltransferase TgpA [Desulfatiferula olefinivorans]
MRPRPDAQTGFLVAALVAGLAPHVFDLPLWITAWCLTAWGVILILDRKKLGLPPRWIFRLLALGAFAAVVVTSRGRFSGDAGIGLLCLMASLKPFEIQTARDRMITVFLAYFMVASGMFFSTTLEMSLYLFFSVIVISGLLIRINHREVPLRSGLILSLTMTLQALPLAVILFTAFPRIQGGLWGIQQRRTGLVGLSGTLSPGSLSGLVKNDAVAFRAAFDGPVPPSSDSYFRGLVFDSFDGRRWREVRQTPPLTRTVSDTDTVTCDIILEPHSERWLFGPDYPVSVSDGYLLLDNHTVRSRERVVSKIRYTVRSARGGETGEHDGWSWVSRSLPAQSNPRTRDLARRFRSEASTDQALVDIVLDFFHSEPFYYTENPPLLGQDPVDEFLFRTRRGYCEHYASAFAVLMRAADIPARVVGGYLGGDLNPYGNYLIVRQARAHAWAEVWLDGRGWVRVDPTAAVAAERVEGGGTGTIQADGGGGDASETRGLFDTLTKNLLMGWDSLNYLWYARVMSYTAQSQRQLFERLGISLSTLKDRLALLGMALVLAGGVTLLIVLWLALRARVPEDPVAGVYRILDRKLERVGLSRRPHEGPKTWGRRVAASRPDLAPEVTEMLHDYEALRYAQVQDRTERLRVFRKRVRRFRPRAPQKNAGRP